MLLKHVSLLTSLLNVEQIYLGWTADHESIASRKSKQISKHALADLIWRCVCNTKYQNRISWRDRSEQAKERGNYGFTESVIPSFNARKVYDAGLVSLYLGK